jgi:hypothetical protein
MAPSPAQRRLLCIWTAAACACSGGDAARPSGGAAPDPLPALSTQDYEIVESWRPAETARGLAVVVRRSLTQRELVQLARDLALAKDTELRQLNVLSSNEAYLACERAAHHELRAIQPKDSAYLRDRKACNAGLVMSATAPPGERLTLRWYGPLHGQADTTL